MSELKSIEWQMMMSEETWAVASGTALQANGFVHAICDVMCKNRCTTLYEKLCHIISSCTPILYLVKLRATD